MYKYTEIKTLHLEITSHCQATCAMCARNYHGGITNPLLPKTNLTFVEQICPPEFINQLTSISLGGNFGDPIIYVELLSVVTYIKNCNPSIFLEIHTNGSARNSEWWELLAKALPNNHIVEFGIDGLEDTHSIYRTNTDYNQIINNASTFIKAGGKARWNFIVFKHNEHQLESARAIAKELGFESFYEKHSSRFIGGPTFNVLDKFSNLQYVLEQPTNQKLAFVDIDVVKNYKKYIKDVEITCQVERTNSIYIDASGQLWPCCFIAAIPYLYAKKEDLTYEYINESKKQLNSLLEKFGGWDKLNLKNRSIQEIVDSIEWQTLWNQSFNDLNVCSRICGKLPKEKVSQCLDQYVELDTFHEQDTAIR